MTTTFDKNGVKVRRRGSDLSSSEEYGWSGGTPAAVPQVLGIRTGNIKGIVVTSFFHFLSTFLWRKFNKKFLLACLIFRPKIL